MPASQTTEQLCVIVFNWCGFILITQYHFNTLPIVLSVVFLKEALLYKYTCYKKSIIQAEIMACEPLYCLSRLTFSCSLPNFDKAPPVFSSFYFVKLAIILICLFYYLYKHKFDYHPLHRLV